MSVVAGSRSFYFYFNPCTLRNEKEVQPFSVNPDPNALFYRSVQKNLIWCHHQVDEMLVEDAI